MVEQASKPSVANGKAVARKIPLRRKIAFAFVPVIVLLVLGELAARIHDHALFKFDDARAGKFDLLRSSQPSVYDEQLGWALKPNTSSSNNYWNKQVTIDGQGFRVHKQFAATDKPCILAAGDSFTFGDGNNDDETWPGYLEELTKERVWNAGVFGYGLDQAVLRAEQLVPKLEPKQLVLQYVPDDVRRCELMLRWAKKPYFQLENGELVLKNVPVPPAAETKPGDIRTLLGHSYLLNSIFIRATPSWWLEDARADVRAHHDGPAVAEKLTERMNKFGAENHCQVLVVGLARIKETLEIDNKELLVDILAEAHKNGVNTLYLRIADTYLNASKHFNGEANRWIAEQIRRKLNGEKFSEAALQ